MVARLRDGDQLAAELHAAIGAVSINVVLAAFALGVSLVTGVLCSLAPAFAALGTNLIEALKEGARSGTGAAGR
jgi:putative ABC transport system permease protein